MQRLLVKYNYPICKDPLSYIPITNIIVASMNIYHIPSWWVQHWKIPHFVSPPFLFWFPRVQADDLGSGNQIRSPQTLRRTLEWESGRCRIQPILEKVVVATFTPKLGVAEVVEVASCVPAVSVIKNEVSCWRWSSCLFHWSHLELSFSEHILYAWLAGLPGATYYPLINSFSAKSVLMLWFPRKQTEICVQKVFGWSELKITICEEW